MFEATAADYLAAFAGHGAVMMSSGRVATHDTRKRSVLWTHVARYVRCTCTTHRAVQQVNFTQLLLIILLLKMHIIAVTLSRIKRWRALYTVNKYTTDALNRVPEMMSDRPR